MTTIRSALVRAYHSPHWIPVLSVSAIASLIGTMLLFSMFILDQRDEKRDRIADQIAGCERGNVVRSDQRKIAFGVADAIEAILEINYRHLPESTANALHAENAPIIEGLRGIGESIDADIDCVRIIKGEP